MFRPICFVFMVAAVLTAASEARAQYGYARGYGGYGWGGWGGASTPGAAAPRGHGYVGIWAAGMFNLDTAQARSINVNTAMRWNQAMFNAQSGSAHGCLPLEKKRWLRIRTRPIPRSRTASSNQPQRTGYH